MYIIAIMLGIAEHLEKYRRKERGSGWLQNGLICISRN
jgi:hypothetical protein